MSVVAQTRRQRRIAPLTDAELRDAEARAQAAAVLSLQQSQAAEARRERRRHKPATVVHGEPMPVARLPIDPLVFAIKQRLESLEGDMALVHETIAAIGDAARVSLLEDASDGGDDPGINQEPQRGSAVSRPIGQEVRRHDVRDVAIKGRRA
jgi:hypothetical protein